jgi:hypothetical protein
MFEADWKPSSWDDEDGQRRHLADPDPKTATVDKSKKPTTTARRAALIK